MLQWITSVASFMLEVTKLTPFTKTEEPTKKEEVKPVVEKIAPEKGRDNWIIEPKRETSLVLLIILFHHCKICNHLPVCPIVVVLHWQSSVISH